MAQTLGIRPMSPRPGPAENAGNALPSLSFIGVSHRYGTRLALADVDITVEEGRVLTLAGRSGCGKTTLLALAAGLIAPTKGEVVNGFPRTACVFQESRLLPWRSALQNIAFSLKVQGVRREERLARACELAGRMGLRPCDLSKYPRELSGGMRQRVSLARALAAGPDLLLLDEPFSALDVGLRRELQDMVMAKILEDGLTAVFVTHDLMEAARMSRDIVVLAPSPGRLVFRKTLKPPLGERDAACLSEAVAGLLREPAVARAFQAFNQETPADAAGAPRNSARRMRSMNIPHVRLVTDMAGRKVAVPARLESVFGYNPMVTALMFALAPNKIAGLGMPPMPPERMMADEAYLSLPVLGVMGGLFGGGKNTFNKAAVKQSGAGAILSLSLSKIDEIEVQAADALQAETGLPTLIYDGALDRAGEVLRRVGDLVGETARGLELAAYFDEKFETVQHVLADIPKAKRRTAYYAQSPTGLLTEPRGARHGEILDFAGAINVAQVHERRGCGRTPISADDLLRWDPDVVIMISDEGKSPGRLFDRMRADPFWSRLSAVKNQAVYEPPAGMYHWFDRPPSINRIIGLVWLADLLYPGRFGWDVEEEVARFYELFYRIELSRKQIRAILGTRS